MSTPVPKRLPRYRTGDAGLDEQIGALIEAASITRNEDLVFEMLVSAVRLGRESVDRGDLKLVNSALKELRHSFLVFEPYGRERKVAIFGSARTAVDDDGYQVARRFGEAMAAREWMVITGAGPGIMEAGIEGAGAERAFGVNILLPFESAPSALLATDPKLINYRYFFTCKLLFLKESHAAALLPGGFGTMDEAFELLTLVQTGRSPVMPIVLLEPAGSTYWQAWREFVVRELAQRNLISPEDLDLVRIHDNVDDAVEEISRFYSVYHSSRYVGRRLVFRLNRDVTDERLAEANERFTDIIVKGTIERVPVSPQEIEDEDVPELPRLVFQFDRYHYARLRHLIDLLNED